MKTLSAVSLMLGLAFVAMAPAQEDRSAKDLQATIWKLEQEKHSLQVRCEALSAQLNDTVKATSKLQKDLIAERQRGAVLCGVLDCRAAFV